MADPVIKDIPSGAWTLVAENVTSGFLHIIETQVLKLWQTYRTTGGTAPTDLAEAIQFKGETEEISAGSAIDVYIYAEGGTAQLRVDV